MTFAAFSTNTTLNIMAYIGIAILGGVLFFFSNQAIEKLPIDEDCSRKEGADYTKRRIAVTVIGVLLSLGTAMYYGKSWETLLLILLFAVLCVVTFIDMETQCIPPALNISIAVLGVISFFLVRGEDAPTLLERIIGIFCVSLPLFLITLIIHEAFGLGDIKMMAAIGVFLGWKGTLMAFFIGLLLGGVYGAYLLITKKKGKKDHFAFGPFLSIGIIASAYAGIGANLVDLYINMIRTMIEMQ